MVPVNGTRRQKELCTECCLLRGTGPRAWEPGEQILKPHCFPLCPSPMFPTGWTQPVLTGKSSRPQSRIEKHQEIVWRGKEKMSSSRVQYSLINNNRDTVWLAFYTILYYTITITIIIELAFYTITSIIANIWFKVTTLMLFSWQLVGHYNLQVHQGEKGKSHVIKRKWNPVKSYVKSSGLVNRKAPKGMHLLSLLPSHFKLKLSFQEF